ncbi:hypothetical protein DSM25558_5210 [Agrobacterium sp. DSM 25558]|uniref:TniQ family protein n=1 Tax=Agrobacterium sp. DSM 25558 TaxID=1907665 RepID=UPI0009725DE3|nr:TniQ family protein [Agrobacterium sp. DSM 25558]SCX31413.1 hypothetical protein DSM25558_5210 [Agrobacterium sp. DSM 25558]
MAGTAPITLPHLPEPKSDETAGSYMVRIAWANGFSSADRFLRVLGLPRDNVHLFSDDLVSRLSETTGLSPETLKRFSAPSGSIIPYGDDFIKRSHVSAIGVRFCHDCLASEKGNGGYIRGTWQWQMISHCPHHGRLLRYDPRGIMQLSDFSELLSSEAEAAIDLDESDAYFTERLLGRQHEGFLDDLPAYVAAELCALVGHFSIGSKTGSFSERIKDGFTDPTVRREGYAIAAHGRGAIDDVMTNFVKVASKTVTYPRRIYSPLLYWWKVNKHLPAYTPVMKMFQEHAEMNIPLERGDTFIWTVPKRNVHTIASAAKDYGLSDERVQRILETKFDTPDLPRFFKRDEIHHWLLEGSAYVTTSDAAKTLGCSMKICDDLIKNDCLATVANRDYDGRVFRLIHKIEIERFAKRLADVARKDVDVKALVPASLIYKSCTIKIADILKLAFDGHVQNIGFTGETPRIENLYFDRTEILKARKVLLTNLENEATEDDTIDIKSAARRLHFTLSTMLEVTNLGLIRLIEKEDSNWKGRPRKLVKLSEVDEFAAHHISLDKLATNNQTDRATMLDALTSKGIRPIFEARFRAAKVYKKSTLSQHGY